MAAAKAESEPVPLRWLMVLWLVCTVIVIGFSLFSYIAGWWIPLVE